MKKKKAKHTKAPKQRKNTCTKKNQQKTSNDVFKFI